MKRSVRHVRHNDLVCPFPFFEEFYDRAIFEAGATHSLTPDIPEGSYLVNYQNIFGTANLTNGATGIQQFYSRGGVDYPFSVSINPGAWGNVPLSILVVKSGDSVKVVSSQAFSMTLGGFIVPEGDPYFRPIAEVLASGDNVIYTVPEGKKAKFLNFQSVGGNIGFTRAAVTANAKIHIVPSGGTAGPSNFLGATSVANFGGFYSPPRVILEEGESLVVNVDQPGMMVFAHLFEYEAEGRGRAFTFPISWRPEAQIGSEF